MAPSRDYHGPREEEFSTRELQRLLEAPLRRPLHVLLPLTVCVVVALALAFLLPPRYSSSTLILVAPDKLVPDNLVQNMNTERIARRLQTLRQEVQSRTRLERVARELDPYGSISREPLIQIIERMRRAVTVTVKGNDAFGIEFEHPEPKMAMLIADRLTTLFMEEVVGARERQVSDAYQFIESQLQEARQELELREQALRDYKLKHMGTLPEQLQTNLQTLQRLQMEQQTVSESLRKAMDAQLLLEGAVSGREAAAPPGTPAPPDSLDALRAELAQMRTRYTEEHPDVKALEARIASMEAAFAKASAPGAPVVDPRRARAQALLEAARLEVHTLRARLADVDRQIAAYAARVEAVPRTEQEIQSLTRDYEKLKENYMTLLSKKLDAEMASKLEQRWRGEQFRVIDPAYLPEKPSFPNRLLFGLAGALAGLALGIGLAVGVDFLDPTVKGAHELEDLLPLPVLGVIPHVKPKEARRLMAQPPGPRRPPGAGDDRAGGAGAGGESETAAPGAPGSTGTEGGGGPLAFVRRRRER